MTNVARRSREKHLQQKAQKRGYRTHYLSFDLNCLAIACTHLTHIIASPYVTQEIAAEKIQDNDNLIKFNMWNMLSRGSPLVRIIHTFACRSFLY